MVKNIIKRILIGVGIIFILNFFRTGSLFGFINTYALDQIQLSNSSGAVLWSGGLTDNFINVNNVKYIIFKFNLDTASQSKYTLDWQFSYTSGGNGSPGLHLDWFLLGSNSYQNPNNSWTTLNQQPIGASQTYLQYINSVPFTSSYNGTQQGQLTYSFDTPRRVTQITYENKRLNYTGSTSAETNATINNGVNNIINNNNTNTNNIINNQNNNTNKIIDSQNKTNDTLNDSTTDDPSSDISSMNGKLASNGSITQLLTLPIQMYQSILNSVSGSCSPFSLGSLYNHDLTLSCINLKNLLGSTLYSIIDILISGLFILSFRKKMVDIFNHMTSLNDRGNEVE